MMPATVASLTTNMNELGHRTATMFLIVSVFALTVRLLPLLSSPLGDLDKQIPDTLHARRERPSPARLCTTTQPT